MLRDDEQRTRTRERARVGASQVHEALGVYADWLLEHGDAYGEALACCLRDPALHALGIERYACPNDVDGERCHELAVWRFEPFARWSGLAEGERSVATELVLLPGGDFTIGSPEDEDGRNDDESQRVVCVAPFLMARVPVTQAVWRGGASGAGLPDDPSYYKGPARPVEQVSWHDAVAWCDAQGLRLPTEEGGEYGSRAGSTTEYCFGSDDSCLAEYAWFVDTPDRKTHDVGLKAANGFGLHDVHGNVWEWCDAKYGPGSASRVLRGGSWLERASHCRSASRGGADPGPGSREPYFGFRPSRSVSL